MRRRGLCAMDGATKVVLEDRVARARALAGGPAWSLVYSRGLRRGAVTGETGGRGLVDVLWTCCAGALIVSRSDEVLFDVSMRRRREASTWCPAPSFPKYPLQKCEEPSADSSRNTPYEWPPLPTNEQHGDAAARQPVRDDAQPGPRCSQAGYAPPPECDSRRLRALDTRTASSASCQRALSALHVLAPHHLPLTRPCATRS